MLGLKSKSANWSNPKKGKVAAASFVIFRQWSVLFYILRCFASKGIIKSSKNLSQF